MLLYILELISYLGTIIEVEHYMKNGLTYILILAMGLSAHAQLDDYKYVIVPKKFDAFKSDNQYQTSTLVKHYLTEYGLTAVYDDALPLDLAENRCLGLMANILDESSMFTTKLKLSFKNCQNEEVYTTREGRSKTKEYDTAYREALQQAFGSFSGIDYRYRPKTGETIAMQSQDRPVTSDLDKVIEVVGSAEEMEQAVRAQGDRSKEHVVEQKADLEEQVYKSVEPRPSSFQRADAPSQAPNLTGVLYAQPLEGGYQLVNSVPEIVLKLEETSLENVFLTHYGGNSAMVFKKDDAWLLEYMEQGEKMTRELQIKF